MLLACVTTAVALVSSAADFFCVLFKDKVSYNVLLLIDCIIGVLICDIGLDNIIQLADPVLGIVYPPFIAVVVLLLFHKHTALPPCLSRCGYRCVSSGRGPRAVRHGRARRGASRLATALLDGARMDRVCHRRGSHRMGDGQTRVT